jgi:predicted negative regulator of RcsB-dependent stress response
MLSRDRRERDGQIGQAIMMTRDNLIYLVIGALVVAVAVLGYQLYEAKKEPTGLHINLGEKGLSIEGK